MTAANTTQEPSALVIIQAQLGSFLQILTEDGRTGFILDGVPAEEVRLEFDRETQEAKAASDIGGDTVESASSRPLEHTSYVFRRRGNEATVLGDGILALLAHRTLEPGNSRIVMVGASSREEQLRVAQRYVTSFVTDGWDVHVPAAEQRVGNFSNFQIGGFLTVNRADGAEVGKFLPHPGPNEAVLGLLFSAVETSFEIAQQLYWGVLGLPIGAAASRTSDNNNPYQAWEWWQDGKLFCKIENAPEDPTLISATFTDAAVPGKPELWRDRRLALGVAAFMSLMLA